MTAHLTTLLGRVSALNVAVIGDAMLDSYLIGTAGRLCSEAPVPVVALSDRSDVPGAAANTAANVAGLGARTLFFSVCGDDPEGQLLRRALEERGVPTDDLLIQPGRRTLVKH